MATTIEITSPFNIPYEDGDTLVHTAERPFCGDRHCSCHDDMEAFYQLIELPTLNGLITTFEAMQFYYGEQI